MKEVIDMKKVGVSTVLTVIGTVCSIVGSIVSTVGSEKKPQETIAKLVKDEFNKQ